MKLGECKCITKYEKDTLTTALNSAKIDTERILIRSQRGEVVVGMPKKEIEERLTKLVGDYRQLEYRVGKTPICP